MVSNLKRLFTVKGMMGKRETNGELPRTGQLYNGLFKMAWPATVESVMMGMVSFVDTIMVSVLGSAAIASVGLTNQPRMIIFAVFFALNVGVTAIVSRRRGQEDKEGANKSLAQALSLCFFLAVLLCGIGIAVAEPFMVLAGANEDTLADATVYFRIIMVGMLFTALSGVINTAQRATGNTKIAMRTNLTANLINICFNYLLISGRLGFPALGVRGAAIALLLGSVVACTMSVLSLRDKSSYFSFGLGDCFKLRPEILMPLIRVGTGAGIEQVFMRIGFFVYAVMVAKLGTTAFATHLICMNIIGLSYTFGEGLGVASSALVGQNLGKKRPDLASLYGKAGQRVGIFISLGLVLLFVFGGNMLMHLFTDPTEADYNEIISMGVLILYIIAASSPAQISQIIFAGGLRGAGDTKYVAVISLVSIAIVRPLLTYLFCFPLGMGVAGAWLSLLIDHYTRVLFYGIRFSGGKWCGICV